MYWVKGVLTYLVIWPIVCSLWPSILVVLGGIIGLTLEQLRQLISEPVRILNGVLFTPTGLLPWTALMGVIHLFLVKRFGENPDKQTQIVQYSVKMASMFGACQLSWILYAVRGVVFSGIGYRIEWFFFHEFSAMIAWLVCGYVIGRIAKM